MAQALFVACGIVPVYIFIISFIRGMLLLGCLVLLAGASRGEPPCLAGLLTFAIVAQGAIVRDGGAEEAKTHSVEEARTYAAVADRAAETSRSLAWSEKKRRQRAGTRRAALLSIILQKVQYCTVYL